MSLPGGGIRRGTTLNKKPVPAEEEAPKQQIKFDIFNEEGGSNTADVPDYKKKTVLDNVSSSLSCIFNYSPQYRMINWTSLLWSRPRQGPRSLISLKMMSETDLSTTISHDLCLIQRL